MSTYIVRAKRWKHGWELRIDGVGVTQSRNLDGPSKWSATTSKPLPTTTPQMMPSSSSHRWATG
jgi:hypothetical protein